MWWMRVVEGRTALEDKTKQNIQSRQKLEGTMALIW